jgi:hypothetical protein
MRCLLGCKNETYDNGMTTGEVLEINHYGSELIPPRPVIRIAAENTIAENKKLIQSYLHNLVIYAMHSPKDIPKIEYELYRNLGSQSIAEAKRMIESGDQLQENAPATIKKKGFNKPLYQKGKLEKSLRYEVEK